MPDAPLARVLAIGDELLLGRTVDTNSAHIARWLGDRGLRVERLAVIGDRQDEIERALIEAGRTCALVLCTGGLGPTDDDRTRHALATAMAAPLAERPAAWKAISAYFKRMRPGPIAESNRRQALMPRGAVMLANDRGTAPGLLGQVGKAWVACFPGVPHEMKAMLDRLAPRLRRLLPKLRSPHVAEIHFAGIGESAAQHLLGDLLSEREPQVGITASELGHITLRAVGTAAQVRKRAAELARAVAAYVIPEPGLAPSVVAALARNRLTITAAESCTCGHVAAMLGAVPGASRVLRESFITYHAAAKHARLGVPLALIREHTVYSEAVALAMAEGARRAAGADLAIATTGIAGPDGGTAAHPVGTVWVAVATASGAAARRHNLRGSRERVQSRAAASALGLAWEMIKSRKLAR